MTKIKFTQIYLTNDILTTDQQEYTAGNVYTVREDEAATYIKAGKAETLNFPTLEAIKREGDRIADNYRSQRDKIKTSLRYITNEAERQYQLEKLEDETAEAIAQKDFEIKAELQALKIEAASKALDSPGTPQEMEEAREKAESIITQLAITKNPSEVFGLIELKLMTMNDADKVELLKRFYEVKARASAGDSIIISDIERSLRTVQNDSMRTLSHISALEKAGVSASLKYRAAKLAQRVQGGTRNV